MFLIVCVVFLCNSGLRYDMTQLLKVNWSYTLQVPGMKWFCIYTRISSEMFTESFTEYNVK